MRRYKSRALALCAGLLFLIGAAPVWADSVDVSASFSCLGSGCSQGTDHEEGTGYQDYDFKGWVYLTASNTGSEDWGDFHFEIFQVGSYSIDNVLFDVSSPNEPTSNRSSLSWNLVDNHTLDVYFYGDPVGPSETLKINVYTNNVTDQVPFFGVLYYPTPIPEPGTAALMGLSLLGLLAAGRRRARR